MPQPIQRDIVVMGSSAGGIEALKQIIPRLPQDFPGAIFIVQHIPAHPPSVLPKLLNARGPERCVHATHGEPIVPGRVYIAPPDMHLTLADGIVRVVRGPRENGHRPAVDPLFRTAARWYGPRVIGVILSGARDCGAAGLNIIKQRGGLAIIQDPADSFCDSMPMNAIRSVEADFILPAEKIAAQLVQIVGTLPPRGTRIPSPGEPPPPLPEPEWHRVGLTCPACNGAIEEADLGATLEFRCHVGHRYTGDGMLQEQSEELETALWAAIRAFEESEELSRRMARHSVPLVALRMDEKADLMRRHSEVIRRMLLGGVAAHPATGDLDREPHAEDDANDPGES